MQATAPLALLALLPLTALALVQDGPAPAGEVFPDGDEAPAEEPAEEPVEEPVDTTSDESMDALEAEYFATTDHDGDGSLTWREAQASLLVDRAGFAQYDDDGDGLISREEFGARMRELIERTGVFQRPLPKDAQVLPVGGEAEPEPTGPSPQAFVGMYDLDVDGRLSAEELAEAAGALGLAKLDTSLILGQLDTDRSGFIEPVELEPALALLEDADGNTVMPELPPAASIEELFGGPEPREVYLGSTPRPPVIAGPVRPFRRLDLDDDGALTREDLDQLLLSSHTPLRPSAILAGFDRDGDGQVDRAELEAAFDG